MRKRDEKKTKDKDEADEKKKWKRKKRTKNTKQMNKDKNKKETLKYGNETKFPDVKIIKRHRTSFSELHS